MTKDEALDRAHIAFNSARNFAAAKEAFLASLKSNGWEVVPVEATSRMLYAAWRLHDSKPTTCAPSDLWRAMLAAAEGEDQ
jgi:hypothetical protein